MEKGTPYERFEAIKCQVCKKQVCWPVVVCFQGHGTCLDCNKSTIECYFCKSPLLQKPPSILEDLLKILPKRCQYYKFGCQSFNDKHEELCEYRNITCMLGKDSSCEWSGFIKDWYIHGLYDHNIHAKLIDYWPSTKSDIIAQYYNFDAIWVGYNMVFNIQNEHFILFSEKSQSLEYSIYIVYLPTKDPSNDYLFKVSFLKGYTPVHKLLLTATPLIAVRDVVMASMPLEALYPLVDRQGNLRIHIMKVKKKVTFET